ncbi:serine/arginine repetitive matrix protein 2 [Brevibacillus agri]|uniref:serine/arginine repetitive matrix protein 2 n=1 Tax=Brevibacillus agri TaxID=51101 RepID=UPI00286FD5F3|nr:serine/arginine repetitive matrix protein 2 [Brevibacillus agri]MDR9503414.1 serine/arginine repetitive matrix protein 2 [Brevibacillus agri]
MEWELFYPDMLVELGSYAFQQGIEIEVYSSSDSYFDWAKVRFTDRFREKIAVSRRDEASIQLGYHEEFVSVFGGFVVSPYSGSEQNEVVLKDDMLLLEDTIITNTFLDATPQEILSFCLNKAGIKESKISTKTYPKKAVVPIHRKNVIAVIEAIHSLWKIKEPFFFADGVFYWGKQPEQARVYAFEYAENIISLQRRDGLWELETVSAPFIRHSNLIRVDHPLIAGEFAVKKTVFRTNDNGFIRTTIYF